MIFGCFLTLMYVHLSNVCEQKQIQALNKLCSSLLEKLNNPREERDAESMCTSGLAPIFNSGSFRGLSFMLSSFCSLAAEQTVFQPC